MRKIRYLILSLVLALAACGKEAKETTQTAGAGDPLRGRRVYSANCAACHSNDPSKDGSVGPAVKGSSQELLEAKILRATYPPGYAPKRQSHSMPAYPFLKSSIPDLTAFLG